MKLRKRVDGSGGVQSAATPFQFLKVRRGFLYVMYVMFMGQNERALHPINVGRWCIFIFIIILLAVLRSLALID